MLEPAAATTPVRIAERIAVHSDSRPARFVSAATLLLVTGWLVLLVAHSGYLRHPDFDEILWPLTVLFCVGFIARGIFLGRPVTYGHAAWAGVAVVTALGANVLQFERAGEALVVAAGLILMWPTSARPQPEALAQVSALIDKTSDDPLAVFAMHSLKSYYFNADRSAAIAYRTRAGFAVVGGDPIGDESRFPALVRDFAAMCRSHGWRVAVLGCSEHALPLWTDSCTVGHHLRAVAVGRDVVVDVQAFDLVGRKYRNLRQGVQRTRNAGITTEIVDERALDGALRAELQQVMELSHGGRYERGFSMLLDGALLGRYPGIRLIIARDNLGVVQGFHRYVTSGGGTDVSLDVPWRRPGSPNGIDERLTVDMICRARSEGARRLSLAFAAFPEIFAEKDRTRPQQICYSAIHMLDPLIALESLYRYLRKFHALGERRYVLVQMSTLPLVAFALLSLEFMPRLRVNVPRGPAA
ncbi:Lysylphosphatidylglycerol biosynthesis bifunctional protein LysX [Mycobacteroides abscessus subsp. massiliense]|uniref:bifunctional lysylphosphatidylglycerol flippase/synthetase MprF n=1 Tax=Mycobacteroides abscessus TaxID=36809 RepID=UPI0009A7511A|nr:phosphatidylglycerol lysyltransferase domain-containing protein [Mycobacteroides abscessus]SKF96561.1 Lysylphosphatidylglycerol biosynthesis bifunctional protein LysX [Mycobacteroides abscessus subsp. massiliense]SKG38012.1 Lysylphosphatidylglycerol biosynthesis bifunctional protein LysX [Mycobacteroides abscessus subsp. massiliense]SKJ02921.1 Lysylphosphatidylglycerol biosynthesis bifunctional protein LysX [Mycobacteroides abscessus subsp. massiliense]SKJ44520.1 Lysylphosphatidylglycerol bi